MRATIAVALVASCVAGMAAFVIGRLGGIDLIESAGAWLTAPLWVVAGVLSVVAVIGLPLAACLRAAEAWRDRRPR